MGSHRFHRLFPADDRRLRTRRLAVMVVSPSEFFMYRTKQDKTMRPRTAGNPHSTRTQPALNPPVDPFCSCLQIC